jgi:hypothetical protein
VIDVKTNVLELAERFYKLAIRHAPRTVLIHDRPFRIIEVILGDPYNDDPEAVFWKGFYEDEEHPALRMLPEMDVEEIKRATEEKPEGDWYNVYDKATNRVIGHVFDIWFVGADKKAKQEFGENAYAMNSGGPSPGIKYPVGHKRGDPYPVPKHMPIEVSIPGELFADFVRMSWEEVGSPRIEYGFKHNTKPGLEPGGYHIFFSPTQFAAFLASLKYFLRQPELEEADKAKIQSVLALVSRQLPQA